MGLSSADHTTGRCGGERRNGGGTARRLFALNGRTTASHC